MSQMELGRKALDLKLKSATKASTLPPNTTKDIPTATVVTASPEKPNTARAPPDTAWDNQLELPGIGYDRFVRYHELKDYGIPFSRQHIASLEEQGRFPRRVNLSPRVIAWRLSSLRAWMATRGQE
jgi:predicted DNA-binding transcriptional regulator AlpA